MELEIRTEDQEGNVVFEGKLTGKELDFVVSIGLNYLLAQGAMPFMKAENNDKSTVVEGTETIQ